MKETKTVVLALFLWSAACLTGTSQELFQRDILKGLNQQYYEILKLKSEQKFTEAEVKCLNFIKKTPNFYQIYLAYTRVMRGPGKFAQAQTLLKNLMKQNPLNPYYPYGMGLLYKSRGKYGQAREYFRKAIDLGAPFRSVYFELGGYCKKEDVDKTIDYFRNRSRINPDNTNVYHELGQIYQYKLRKYDLAKSYYQEELNRARKTGNHTLIALALSDLGLFSYYRRNIAEALAYFKKGTNHMEQAGNHQELASLYYNCGLMHCYLGNSDLGLKWYQKGLKQARSIEDKAFEAKMNGAIGSYYYTRDDHLAALNYYNKALQAALSYSDWHGQARYLSDIGNLSLTRGHLDKAREYYSKALALARGYRNVPVEGSVLRALASVYQKAGDYCRSLDYCQQALRVNRLHRDKPERAAILAQIGSTYRLLGNFSKAEQYYRQAQKIYLDMGISYGEGTCVNNIAGIYFTRGDYKKARELLGKAITIARQTGNKLDLAYRIINMSMIYRQEKNYQEAMRCLGKARELVIGSGFKRQECSVWTNQGYLYLSQKHYGKARQAFLKALKLTSDLGDVARRGSVYAGLGDICKLEGKCDSALKYYKNSIADIEKIRSKLPLEEYKSGFMENKLHVYEDLVGLLYQMHRQQSGEKFDQEGLFFVEKAKARAFLDSLYESKYNLKKGLDNQLREQEFQISRRISKIQSQLTRLEPGDLKRKEILKNLEQAEEEYNFNIQKIKQDNPHYASLVYPQPYRLGQIRKYLLDRRTGLLEYYLTEDRAYLFLITTGDFSVYQLSDTWSVTERAKDYINLLSRKRSRQAVPVAAGKRLFMELMGPIKKKIKNLEHLIIIPDGYLHYLPFETLIVSSTKKTPRYLVQNYWISYAPSASSLVDLLKRKKIKKPGKGLLAFADPIYPPPPSGEKHRTAAEISREAYLNDGFELYPLKYSGEEVRNLEKFFNKNDVDVFVREEAKEEKIKTLNLMNYKILHFATHGLLDEMVPHRSSLVLTLDNDPGEDGFLQAREIYNVRINADLVVLSACKTGKGKLMRGEGVSGLYRAFLYAGSSSVIVSLWNINDRVTADFMDYFYYNLSLGKSKGESLRQAKIKMIKSKHGHPLYWAPFILHGESRSAIGLKE